MMLTKYPSDVILTSQGGDSLMASSKSETTRHGKWISVGCYINDSENGLEIDDIYVNVAPYTFLSLWGLFGVVQQIRGKHWSKKTFEINGFDAFCW
jgi:hypothetical protein